MSPNWKKALVLFVAFLIAIIAGLAASLAMGKMVESASGWTCLACGCGVWALLFFGSAGIIGLFDFRDTRPPALPHSPSGDDGHASSNHPGAPVV
ncbi:hypothetical protein OG824_13765 [Streptomyces prunicolor]|uniref:hypothetical protein n=1 Tax=Streptomyces prunicolor TaxID=67348 RepID=UPI0022540E0B|nr:hypothetical protein [Streptomyces prunicolor]MCX5236268.1 hypothetical protein [Streptomyces prunicolor]